VNRFPQERGTVDWVDQVDWVDGVDLVGLFRRNLFTIWGV
jgi:hypothetical protein